MSKREMLIACLQEQHGDIPFPCSDLRTILVSWIESAITCWFKSGNISSFAPFARYFTGHEDLEDKFLKMYQAEFPILGHDETGISLHIEFIHAVSIVVTKPNFFTLSPEGFTFLIEFLANTDLGHAIIELTKLHSNDKFLRSKNRVGHSLFSILVEHVYSSEEASHDIEYFFRKAVHNLIRDPSPTWRVFERLMGIANSPEEKLQYLKDIRPAYEADRLNVKFLTPKHLPSNEKRYNKISKRHLDRTFYDHISDINDIEEILDGHPLVDWNRVQKPNDTITADTLPKDIVSIGKRNYRRPFIDRSVKGSIRAWSHIKKARYA